MCYWFMNDDDSYWWRLWFMYDFEPWIYDYDFYFVFCMLTVDGLSKFVTSGQNKSVSTITFRVTGSFKEHAWDFAQAARSNAEPARPRSEHSVQSLGSNFQRPSPRVNLWEGGGIKPWFAMHLFAFFVQMYVYFQTWRVFLAYCKFSWVLAIYSLTAKD